jgi:hypothetical protein
MGLFRRIGIVPEAVSGHKDIKRGAPLRRHL